MLGSNNRSKKRQQQETGSVVSKECSGDVEEMKKRFQKQNHDIVKVNARFATKIRELENQRVDLAAKFFSLEARILHLESENKLMKEHRRDLERLSSGMMQMNANKSLETAVETINSFMESMSATAAALERMVLPALNDGMRFVSLCDMVFNSSPDMSPVECYPEKSANPLSPPLGPRVTPRNDDVDRLTPISEETDANMISETLQESRSSPVPVKRSKSKNSGNPVGPTKHNAKSTRASICTMSNPLAPIDQNMSVERTRRGRQIVSYAEPSLRTKLRKGDRQTGFIEATRHVSSSSSSSTVISVSPSRIPVPLTPRRNLAEGNATSGNSPLPTPPKDLH